MLYNEDFKKQVVKKVLSPGVIQNNICRKLKICPSTIRAWRRKYGEEIQNQIQELDLNSLLYEPPVDIEELLSRADQQELIQINGCEALALQLDQLRQKGKMVSQYTDANKYAVVMSFRAMTSEQQGMWLRRLGLQSNQLKIWEEQIFTMSKKTIENDQYIKQLEGEVCSLKKLLSESERNNRELKVLIELKKKYPLLFHQEEVTS